MNGERLAELRKDKGLKQSGDSGWRTEARDLFIIDQTTPKAFVELVTKKKLSDI